MGVKKIKGLRQVMIPCTRPAPQVCRQMLIICRRCGCKARMTRRWISTGLPTCSCGGKFHVES